MFQSETLSELKKEQLIQALQAHQLNTVIDLRRVERKFAAANSPDVMQPMTSAWTFYVNSQGLLIELRGFTRNYPFSSECVDEAKRRVYLDPESNKSWNLAWLVLRKIQTDQLILSYANYQAALPAMWGNQIPSAEGIARLAAAFRSEWTYGLAQMLRHWEQPPVC
ncbi:uncharacterized protein K452DRAFT_329632 [Aplosporella prunicola CBS 121167]|uniref:Uncharacterized protein n=1 Tax=Aplosporella prunicola CBS 121167 TaxID=1176127 RepID=A0A6A6B0J7_9PEZI|nr:uncharacterized protein K452DRAFT_329632 [Aplosporella prunicola CBS 121167]KAF2136557.1 hypothetical protein K452DRAFT_329632 [Aplosporella prunicola CBS 121167]